MRSKVVAAASMFLLGMMIASLAVAQDFPIRWLCDGRCPGHLGGLDFNREIALENFPVTPLLPTLRPITATAVSFYGSDDGSSRTVVVPVPSSLKPLPLPAINQ
jgi:hypothetical protein